LVIFRSEKAVTQHCEHPLLECVLVIVVAVVDEHSANRNGMADNSNLAERQPGNHDWPLEMFAGPRFDRVIP
jgi:hypothetical protein